MVDMLSVVKKEFPELYTKRGVVKKQKPKQFKCDCGNEFNKTKKVNFGWVGFAIPVCSECGGKAKKSVLYNIWKRMINNQIEQEDFILNVVMSNPSISKERIQMLLAEKFDESREALGYLVYFGYLQVDKEKRDTLKHIEYTVNQEKDLSHRYEIL
ncbi:hypothetical protein AT268_33165 [Bacillus cereus]|uniref:Uncharacterized protein n=1 Tax=Bacillus cereus TaxID=1396 RepID=A0A9X0SPL2_BACCE|nr:hypothetical protein [Bacillus cereus]KXY51332.1 hypothetical protein AT268_33165 [Bacillus cereus]